MSKKCPNELKFCEVSRKKDAENLDKQKSFVLKKICGMFVIETLKCKISDFLN